MGELLSIFWPSHAQQLSEGIWRSLRECFKTDFVISVNKNDGVQRLLKAHYLILAIFCPSLTETDEKIIEFDSLSNVNEKDLQCLLEFIYKGKTKVSVDRMGNIKTAAKQLGLAVLVESIEKCEIQRLDDAAMEETDTDESAIPSVSISDEDNENSEDEEKSERNSRNCKNVTQVEEQLEEISDPEISQKGLRRSRNTELNESQASALFDHSSRTCHLCSKSFSNRSSFRLHIRIHTGTDNKQQCPHCPNKFPKGERMVKHLAQKHQRDTEGNVLEKKFKCDECDYRAVYQCFIKNHKGYKHGEKARKCDQCSYSCHNNADLLLHKAGVHSDHRPYMCEQCGFRSKTKSGIRLHMTMHQEKIPCDICGALYRYRALARHKKHIHCADKKAFACHVCPYATSCNSYLQTHLTKVHKIPPSKPSKTSHSTSYPP